MPLRRTPAVVAAQQAGVIVQVDRRRWRDATAGAGARPQECVSRGGTRAQWQPTWARVCVLGHTRRSMASLPVRTGRVGHRAHNDLIKSYNLATTRVREPVCRKAHEYSSPSRTEPLSRRRCASSHLGDRLGAAVEPAGTRVQRKTVKTRPWLPHAQEAPDGPSWLISMSRATP